MKGPTTTAKTKRGKRDLISSARPKKSRLGWIRSSHILLTPLKGAPWRGRWRLGEAKTADWISLLLGRRCRRLLLLLLLPLLQGSKRGAPPPSRPPPLPPPPREGEKSITPSKSTEPSSSSSFLYRIVVLLLCISAGGLLEAK